MKKRRRVKVWVGLCDDQLVRWPRNMLVNEPRDEGEFFFTKKAARKAYEDVRRAELVIEGDA